MKKLATPAYIHYHIHVKTITVNVSEPVYLDFQAFAEKNDRTTSELIREAMSEYQRLHIHLRKSIQDIRPASLGKAKGKLNMADVAEEMMA